MDSDDEPRDADERPQDAAAPGEDDTADGTGDDDTRPGADQPQPDSGLAVFDDVREILTGDPDLSLDDVASQAGLPLQILREVFDAMDWGDRDAYDERDVAYASDIARMLDFYPLESVVRTIQTRYRAMTSIVVSDLGTVRDRLVAPALASGADVDELAAALGRTAEDLVPLSTRNLAEDYRHVLLDLLDSDALARGVGGGREVDLAVGFIDVAGYTALSGRVDPAGLEHVLSGFEDLVTEAVTTSEALLAKFVGDAAMLVSTDVLGLADLLLGLVEDQQRLAEAPRKAGIAYGPVLVRQGDYYGATPNLAARLTDHARPWTLLASEGLQEQLERSFSLSSIPSTTLRGVGEHRPLRVRRPDDD